MRIKCTKQDFALIISACCANDNCYRCVLNEVCKMREQEAGKACHQRLTELIDIIPDEQTD